MHKDIAIYRPDDIPSGKYDWDASFKPIIELLTHIGLKPKLPQRRLHPDWRTQLIDGEPQGFDVIEISAQQFAAKKHHLHLLGFEPWPEHRDAVSELYSEDDDDL